MQRKCNKQYWQKFTQRALLLKQSKTECLNKAYSLNMNDSTPEVKQGKELLLLMEKEKACIAAVVASSESRNLNKINEVLVQATQLNLQHRQEVIDAVNIKETILLEISCVESLKVAVEKNDVSLLFSALSTAAKLGLSGPEVNAAREASNKLGKQSEARTKLIYLSLIICNKLRKL